MESPSPDYPPAIPFADVTSIHRALEYTNWVSIALSLFTLITYTIFKRDFPRSMPLWLSCSAVCMHGFFLLGPLSAFKTFESGGWCAFQGIGIHFTSMSCFCWLCCISVHLYMVVVLKYSTSQVKEYAIWIFVCAFGIPLLFTLIPGIASGFVPGLWKSRGHWCWISEINGGAWEFGVYYCPLLVIAVVTAVCWCSVLYRVAQVSTQFKTNSYVLQTSIGILLFLVSLVVQFVHRIINVAHPASNSYYLEITHVISDSAFGIFVFVIFGFTYDNFTLYCERFGCKKVPVYEDQSFDDTESYGQTDSTATINSTYQPFQPFTPIKDSPYKGYSTTMNGDAKEKLFF
eukprot:TRINITY_DN3320_c0_g1_i1.p1 TRINITY_DN3320_c0_g1~~TRINITY_DN3320_c0_g1_i1.p1  ORF type:complete len:345 (+),score=24.36 TRINITY_DN3320_c0_g1_i1:20-1054(+)